MLTGEGCLPKLLLGAQGDWRYLYFLKLGNNDIYVGSTNDLRRRVKSHDDSHVLSTQAHLPVVLKSYIAVKTESLARALERYFKSGSG
jgi:predicted GIY-YIG superfamily endonuclease